VRWIRFQAGSQASSTRSEKDPAKPRAGRSRGDTGSLWPVGIHGRRGAVGDSQLAGNLTGKQSFYACVRVVRSTPDIQRIRISQNNCFRGLRSRDPGAAQLLLVSHLHLVTKGHDVVLQLLLNLGNLVSGLVQGCI
jgi:hypothetical protein